MFEHGSFLFRICLHRKQRIDREFDRLRYRATSESEMQLALQLKDVAIGSVLHVRQPLGFHTQNSEAFVGKSEYSIINSLCR